MSIFVETTDSGIGLMVQALFGDATIEFTRFEFGNGDVPSEPEKMTELGNKIFESPVVGEIVKGENYVDVATKFDNRNVSHDFTLTEIGVFAIDVGTQEEVMFAYIHLGDQGEPVLSTAANKLVENEIVVRIIIDKAINVTASVASTMYAYQKDFDDHLKDYDNPHKVTKAQIGLGEVPNTHPKDTEIKFTEAQEIGNIMSGDTIGTVFGKIAAAIRALIAHIANKNNPHQITPMSIGAAGEGHSHATSDIKTGVLTVLRGGTGKNNWIANRILFAAASDELGQIKNPDKKSFLVQGSSGAPYFEAISEFAFFSTGKEAPDSTNILWIDTTPTTGGLKYHNGTEWTHVPVAYVQ